MKELFKANDIRGLYPSEVNDELFYHIGLALPKILRTKKVAIGRDIRLSSNSLFSELAEGLNDQGMDVLDLGLCDTPYTYFISGKYKLPCLMITASHNPEDYNGLKIILPNVHTLTDKQVKTLLKEIKIVKSKKKAGKIIYYNKKKEYLEFLLKQADKKFFSQLKIVIDCSNGMAETIVPAVFSKTSADVVYINKKSDGLFPAHFPNPAVKENLRQLQDTVLAEKANLGIMFDGDCDRVAFIDELGEIIDPSITASIFTHYLLQKELGNIVYNTSAGRIFPETIKLYGGTPILALLGHRFMKKAMRKSKAIFGAEYTGHYYFKSNWEADSGIIAALLFYEIASRIKTPLSLLRKTFEKYYSLGEINYKVADREAAFKKVVSFIKSCKPDWEKSFDGYAASKKNQFGETTYATIRKSNTENLIRITIESTSRACAEEFKREMNRILK